MEHGLPDGAARRAPTSFDFVAVRRALAALDADALASAHRVALLAWLAGGYDHWPSRFTRELGELGDDLRALLRAKPHDENRYLKLKRISVENLASALG